MDVKSEIVMELNGKKRHTISSQVEYDFGPIDEISTIDLPFLTISFLNGCVYDNHNLGIDSLGCLEEYTCLLEKIGVISQELKSTCKLASREDKINIHNIKKSFTFYFIDWDDRDWVIKLLEYFYILAIEKMFYLKEEMTLVKKQTKKTTKVSRPLDVIRLEKDLQKDSQKNSQKNSQKDSQKDLKESNNLNTSLTTVKFNRSDLLRRRINPKYTLEEFGDVIAERLRQMKEEPKIKIEQRQKTIDEIREEDEEKDEKHVYKGNTENVG